MLNWGLLSAGSIARVFCNAMRFSKTSRIVAVASRERAKADRLADDFAIARRYDRYEDLLADPEVQAVYISTIHPAHAEWSLRAAEAGKHILVEKPIAMNAAETELMIRAAQANDVFLMEAFMYRCHPQIQALRRLLEEGAIGQVLVVRSAFSYHARYDPANPGRAYAKELGGGGILDVGCYPASMARLIAGAADGKPFANPVQVKGLGRLAPTGVDACAAAVLQFENEIIAEIMGGVGCDMPTDVQIYGSQGSIILPDPWLPSSPCRSAQDPLPLDTAFPPAKILLQRHGDALQEIVIPADRDLFTYEIDTVAENIANRQAPAMPWADSLGNMRLIDRWLAEVGVEYR